MPGHVSGFLRAAQKRPDAEIVGVFDADPELRRKYAQQFGLPDSTRFGDLSTLLESGPDAGGRDQATDSSANRR